MSNTDERYWNDDLKTIIKKELEADYPNVKVESRWKVLKDIFLNTSKTTPKHKLQFGFVEQDIVIFEETINIEKFYGLDHILIHNNEKDEKDELKKKKKNQMVIPKLIIELKYNGVNSHGLITYSDYASDIKSIFPECKYWLAIRYRKTSSDNKLKRHGKNFDRIIYFSPEKSPGNYAEGAFEDELRNDSELKYKFEMFVEEIRKTLQPPDTGFVK